ncbi:MULTISPECIES: PTS transporter subunit EIIC [Lacticaseibacillus]|uniref:PTS transporter subunit EIIC n=1 Tax=Lacticaseibacillus huelsenbergensis TaxID=3035291 RepID=A0ABY8DTD3_9LACO|nr:MULTISPECIES: PTS transporter subunit EIIC [Lacticaseibacillus]MDG3062285.1 PTS transporter subunit EIIC [Lacticaseibacillus sp. BCRC 81376]WFB40256.1 PTS transporter subunit EIIC [Lacticaseibacillus huelsenbergensis]
MEKHERIGNEIIANVGRLTNVGSVARCYTRLRIRIKDDAKVELDKLNEIEGVVKAFASEGKVQIVMPGYLDKVFEYINAEFIGGSRVSEAGSAVRSVEVVDKNRKPFTLKRLLNGVLDAISNSLTPVIGGLAMAGLFLALLNLLTVSHIVAQGSQTYRLLYLMGNSLFYFLPFLVAYGASRYFKTNTILSLMLAGIMMQPDFVKMVSAGSAIHLFGIPVAAVDYSTSLIPILVTVWVQSLLEKVVDRPWMNKFGLLKMFPVFLIMAPLTLLVTGPIGQGVASVIANGSLWIYDQAPVVGITLLSLLIGFFIITGSHWVFFPVAIANLKQLGYDPFLWVAFAVWNFAELGMALAILVKGKKRSVKTFSATAAFSIAASGITEPAVYGLMLKMKKPIIPSTIASGVGGLFFSLCQVKVFSLVTVSILSLPQFINPAGGNNFVLAVVGLLLTTAVSFVLNWFWGIDESMFDEDEIEAAAEV